MRILNFLKKNLSLMIILVLMAIELKFLRYWFREYLSVCIFIWIALPCIAFGIRIKRIRSHFSPSALCAIRDAILITALIISLGFFGRYESIRDIIGYRYVDGYYTTTTYDVDDTGRETMGTDGHASHWYLSFGMWLFECGYVVVCILIPALTWYGANKAVDDALSDAALASRWISKK